MKQRHIVGITSECVVFDGFELGVNGTIETGEDIIFNPKLVKVQDGGAPYKIFCLLFGLNCNKQKVVHIDDIFDGAHKSKRMDKIMEGIQMPNEILREIFKYDTKKVMLTEQVSQDSLMRYANKIQFA